MLSECAAVVHNVCRSFFLCFGFAFVELGERAGQTKYKASLSSRCHRRIVLCVIHGNNSKYKPYEKHTEHYLLSLTSFSFILIRHTHTHEQTPAPDPPTHERIYSRQGMPFIANGMKRNIYVLCTHQPVPFDERSKCDTRSATRHSTETER